MASARRSLVVLLSATALACLGQGLAMSQMGVGPAAAPAVPQQQASSEATPPPTSPPPPPRLRTIHRQVSRLPLQREYRSRPLINNANAAAQERINELLERVPEPMAFNESPLRDVAERLSEVLGVPVDVDSRALEDLGIDLDMPLTFSSRGKKGHAILRRMLGPLDLAWIVQDEVLLVTTKEKVEENLEVRLYCLPSGYECDGSSLQPLIDLVQSTVAADTWDTVGGPAAIRLLDIGPATQLVVSTTHDVHREIEGLLRGLHEQAMAEFGGPEDPGGKAPAVRVHHVADARAREDLATKLAELCNASLPANADPEARVTVLGESLAVQSGSPEFHALAGQIIRAVNGEQVPDFVAPPVAPEIPSETWMRGLNGAGFCWVARAVYGKADARWLLFRSWLAADAPRRLRDLYAVHGEAFAAWIEEKPVAKAAVRLLMDQAIGSR